MVDGFGGAIELSVEFLQKWKNMTTATSFALAAAPGNVKVIEVTSVREITNWLWGRYFRMPVQSKAQYSRDSPHQVCKRPSCPLHLDCRF